MNARPALVKMAAFAKNFLLPVTYAHVRMGSREATVRLVSFRNPKVHVRKARKLCQAKSLFVCTEIDYLLCCYTKVVFDLSVFELFFVLFLFK